MTKIKIIRSAVLKQTNKLVFKFSLILFFVVLSDICLSQTYFQKVYLSSPYEQEGQDVLSTPDGGYLIAGYTTNSTLYDCDVYIIKTDAVGNLLWTKTYGGAKPDFPYHMIATNDGNYFLVGYSQSYGGGDLDILLLKIDPAGNLIWTKTYGGFGNDVGKDIISTSDGNYMIVGWSNSPALGNQKANLIKIDISGTVIWNKLFGGTAPDYGHSVQQCLDGGYIMLGQTFSYGAGNGDAYLVKTDVAGNIAWTKTFGGLLADEGTYILANSDNSFTFVIRDSCNAGMDIDTRIVKTDGSGNLLWSKVYGGAQKDTPKMIQPTSDGGYIVAAISRSFGWINPDMWILKFDASGDTTWTKHYGGVNNEHCYAVREQADGSYIAIGKTASFGPDMDPIFLKLNSNGTMAVGINTFSYFQNKIKLYPNPTDGLLNVDLTGFKVTRITITDVVGQEVFNKEFHHEEKLKLKLSDKTPGMYYLKSESENSSVTSKLIIN